MLKIDESVLCETEKEDLLSLPEAVSVAPWRTLNRTNADTSLSSSKVGVKSCCFPHVSFILSRL